MSHLDSPVAAGEPADVGGGHLPCFPAGQDEGVFLEDYLKVLC
jgi:hypothetical protein